MLCLLDIVHCLFSGQCDNFIAFSWWFTMLHQSFWLLQTISLCLKAFKTFSVWLHLLSILEAKNKVKAKEKGEGWNLFFLLKLFSHNNTYNGWIITNHFPETMPSTRPVALAPHTHLNDIMFPSSLWPLTAGSSPSSCLHLKVLPKVWASVLLNNLQKCFLTSPLLWYSTVFSFPWLSWAFHLFYVELLVQQWEIKN